MRKVTAKISRFGVKQTVEETKRNLDLLVKWSKGELVKTADMGDWIYLDSSNLEAVRFDPDIEELHVMFKTEAIYTYDLVPEELVEDLLNAGSHGSFFYWNIRTDFPYKRIK